MAKNQRVFGDPAPGQISSSERDHITGPVSSGGSQRTARALPGVPAVGRLSGTVGRRRADARTSWVYTRQPWRLILVEKCRDKKGCVTMNEYMRTPPTPLPYLHKKDGWK